MIAHWNSILSQFRLQKANTIIDRNIAAQWESQRIFFSKCIKCSLKTHFYVMNIKIENVLETKHRVERYQTGSVRLQLVRLFFVFFSWNKITWKPNERTNDETLHSFVKNILSKSHYFLFWFPMPSPHFVTFIGIFSLDFIYWVFTFGLYTLNQIRLALRFAD